MEIRNPITKSIQRPREVRRSLKLLKYVPKKAPVIINLLDDHPNSIADSGKLFKLKTEIREAREKNCDPQLLTLLETQHATMTQEFELALEKARTVPSGKDKTETPNNKNSDSDISESE